MLNTFSMFYQAKRHIGFYQQVPSRKICSNSDMVRIIGNLQIYFLYTNVDYRMLCGTVHPTLVFGILAASQYFIIYTVEKSMLYDVTIIWLRFVSQLAAT